MPPSNPAQEKANEFIEALQLQIQTFGKSAEEAKAYELALKGATDAQVKAIKAAQDHLKSLNAESKAYSTAASSVQKSLAGSMAFATGKIDTASDALKNLGTIASAIPGPWGAAASAITGTLSSIIELAQGPFVASQRAARNAYLEVATGAKSLQQAMSQIKVDAFREVLDEMVRASQVRSQVATLFDLQGGLAGIGIPQGENLVNQVATPGSRAAVRARQRQNILQELAGNEDFQRLQNEMTVENTQQRVRDLSNTLGAQARATRVGNMAFATGATGAQAADAARREQLIEETARRTRAAGETEAQARERVTQSLQNLLPVLEQEQRAVRQANFAQEAILRNQNPIERAERRLTALNEARGRLNEDQRNREALSIFEEMRDSVAGAMNRLPPVLLEGSQEAAVAIAAAQREARANDPQTQMVAILETLREAQDQRNRLAEEANRALQQLAAGGQGI